MEVTFRYFAACREAVGRRDERVQMDEGATGADALRWIRTQHPACARFLSSARVAVNQEFVSLDTVLNDGDELAVIPPVSGGSGKRALLTHEAIATDAATQLIQPDGAGAVATFAGIVRPTSKTGRSVTDLEYEAYEEMALSKLQQCLDEAAQAWTLLDLAVVHRLGHLRVGEVAVSIAVSSAHRDDAFQACRFIIDRVKEIVPIWKKETGPDGVEWVSEGA
jgi:molybdopterin converting factor subunit 1